MTTVSVSVRKEPIIAEPAAKNAVKPCIIDIQESNLLN